MALTLEQLHTVSPDEEPTLLDGLYDHSTWVARGALAATPFRALSEHNTTP